MPTQPMHRPLFETAQGSGTVPGCSLHPLLRETVHSFAVAFLLVDALNKWWQFLHVGRVAVYQCLAAVVPPCYACLTVSLHIALSLHKQFQLFFQFLPRYAVALEYVEQISRCERQLLVEQVFYLAFLFCWVLPSASTFPNNK